MADKKNKNEIGLRILTIFAGLFFLIPGFYKIFFPSDFQVFLSNFPEFIVGLGILGFLFWLVTALQVIGGLALLFGRQIRIFAIPYAIISIVALLTVAIYDNESSIQFVSILSHVMGTILYTALLFTGGPGKHKDIVDKYMPRNMNFGIFLVRFSLGILFAIAGLFHLIGIGGYSAFVGSAIGISGALAFVIGLIVALIEFLGGLALIAGYKYRMFILPLVAILIVAIITTLLPDTSMIWLINLLYHVLMIGALISLKFFSKGSYALDK